MRPISFKMFKWLGQNMGTKFHQLSLSGMPLPDIREFGVDISFLEYMESGIDGASIFRKTLANKYSVGEENVLPTIGGSGAIYIGISGLSPERLYLNVPEYEPFFRIAEATGKEVIFTDLRSATPDDSVNSAIAFSNPNNPTGMMLEPPELEQYEEVFVDETFMEFTGRRAPVRLREGMAIAGTMSKFYGAPRTRAGWIIAEGEMMDRFRTLENLTSNNNSDFMLYIAAIILKNEELIRNRNQKTISENRKLVDEFIADNSLDCTLTDGVPFCFPGYNIPISSERLCEKAVREAEVLLVPGSIFGMEGHFRLCFTTDKETLSQGLERLSVFLKNLRKSV